MQVKRLKIYVYLFCLILGSAKNAFLSTYGELSSFEKASLDRALTNYHLSLVDDPYGKIVSEIYVYTESPFLEKTGLLSLGNYFHINTKEDVIKKNLFLAIGDYFDEDLIRDSEIRLRQGVVRSLAFIVAVQSKKNIASEIALLVVSRDTFSLGPSFSFAYSDQSLTNLSLSLSEQNLFGLNKSLGFSYDFLQARHLLSLSYFDPHFITKRWQLFIKPGLIFDRKSFSYTGFLGEIAIERPLLSRRDKWGYSISADFGSKPVIDFKGSNIRQVDFPETAAIEKIERRYRYSYLVAKSQIKRSFGDSFKKEIFLGYGLNIKRPAIAPDLELSEQQRQAFIRHVLPKNELESFITLGFSYFHNEYLSLYDYESFRLQELERLGPYLTISNDFASAPVLLSDQSFVRPKALLCYTKALGKDSFISLSLSTSNRFEGRFFSDNTYSTGFSLVSSKLWGLGRLIIDGRLVMNFDNRDNYSFVLGANNGLRGAPYNYYRGPKYFRGNVEIRSLPISIWFMHLGLVGFYDVGSAFAKWSNLNPNHAIGLGLRALIPALSAQVFRIDLAVPLAHAERDLSPIIPSFGVSQAF